MKIKFLQDNNSIDVPKADNDRTEISLVGARGERYGFDG
jgi:hypothetical protein